MNIKFAAFDKRFPKLIAGHGTARPALSVTWCRSWQTNTPVRRSGKWTRNDPKRSASMAVTLNRQAYEHAEEFIEEGTFVFRRARCMERAPAVRTGAK